MNPAFEQTYTITSLIGKGGMSSVYAAEHKRLHTRWAVKIVEKTPGAGFDILAEANILKRLSNPMLPRIVDIFEDADSIIIVEDFVEGITLDELLKRQGRVEEKQAVRWFRELAGLLGYLHAMKPRPIIYRDMKPSNVMLQPDGSLKLIDFGIAREYKEDKGGDTTYIGTKGYAAPEQFGTAQSDARTDIYSLGVTMYHLITGKSPYQPPYSFVPARQLVSGLSAGIEYILNKCVQPAPEDRYSDTGALLADLNDMRRFDAAYKRFKRRRRARTAVVCVLAVAGAALMALGVWRIKTEKQEEYRYLVDSAQPGSEWRGPIGQAEALLPNEAAAYEKHAWLLFEEGAYDECVELCTEKLAVLGGPPDTFLTVRASAYYALEDYEAAADDYYAAGTLAMDEENLRDYAVCLARLGQLDEAGRVLEQLSMYDGGADVTDYVRGEVCAASGDVDGAREAFASVIAETGDSTLMRRAYVSLAEVYRDAGAYDDSIALIEEALARSGLYGDTVLCEMLGAAYYSRGMLSTPPVTEDMENAARRFMECVGAGIQKEYLYTNAFAAYQAVGEYDSAASVLEAMRSAWPDSYVPRALNAMLLIMVENRKPEGERDYSAAYGEYLEAERLSENAQDTTRLDQLRGLMDQLRAGGWLEEE